MECFTTTITGAPILPDKCEGATMYTDCVIQEASIPLLGLDENSTQTEINNALVLASQNALTRVEEMEAIVDTVVIPDGSETKVQAGANTTVTGTGTVGNPYIVSTSVTNIENYIINNEGYTMVGNTLTILSNWEWKINNENNLNATPIVENIPLASVGNSRIDLIVLAENDLAYRVAGTETTGTAVSPAEPINTIAALFIYSDSTVHEVTTPTPIYPISQNIRLGETTYAPSEDIVYQALYLKAYDADVVHLEGNEVLRNGKKTFVNTSVDNAIEVDNQSTGGAVAVTNQSTGKGISLTNVSSGDAIYINNETAATGTPIKIAKNGVVKGTINDNGEFEGNKIVKTGATTNDFLKGNGDVDSNVYENTTNKQNSLNTDGTGLKYPTVDAVKAITDNIYSLINPNTYVVTDAGYSQLGQNITINTGWEWLIDNNLNSNGAPIIINIPLAVTTFNRIDIIVLDNTNTAQLISGTETTGTPAAPTTPLNTIGIIFLYVDSIIAIPKIPRPLNTVSQELRNGQTQYSPSENIVFDALALKADTTYVDSLLVGLLDDRGNYDASTNLFPSTGGSGVAGAILKGDIWYISVAGTLGGTAVDVGYSVRALVDSPAQTAGNWSILPNSLGYVPENTINKSNSQGDTASTVKFPTWAAVVTYVGGLFSNLKTVGGTSLIGAGDVAFKTVNSTAVTGSGNISTIFPSRETGTTSSISNTDNGGLLIITASCTITIPSGLVAGFECSFVTLAGATLTIALGGGVTLENNASLIMLPQYSFTLKNRTAANAYIATGYL